ncbi:MULTISPECIES: hypothetical protein [unclassified Rhodococcus (in: high G+C Gram-positive bacteria)]|uniref:hypothetical protein n=1 Tax=unclassified Rhodococcus (in: high G+C Gram-positive bacteria) TaxID=192944 RepID=UPI0002D92C9B|nr:MULTISPECIES: hypothetical protein [unclassified Rhodococcus (in: high G+C Gram-positive bacteria)]MBC2637461.1 hypothetical protein [Rhodococcus sp. 3A]MBC2898192.1 hypothetical protein [Rhodococcus sp. 4CII]
MNSRAMRNAAVGNSAGVRPVGQPVHAEMHDRIVVDHQHPQHARLGTRDTKMGH